MRLLYVIDSLAPGGAETSLLEMAPGLIRGGVELHILPLGPASFLRARLETAGAVVHEPVRGGRVANVRGVIGAAHLTRPDLIHTTLFEADVAGRSAARILRLPASTSLVNDSYGEAHSSEASASKIHAALVLDRMTARFAGRFHSISAAVAERVGPRLGLDRSQIEVIPRGRDPHSFPFRTPQSRDSARRALGIGLDEPLILAIGRLEPQKGLLHLLDAASVVATKHPRAIIAIAGKEGRSSDQLRAKAAESPLTVQFLGHRTDVPTLLAGADVFCFPSEREGLGGVLVEALAVGCPVVASSIPTSLEVLAANGPPVGLLAPVGDAGSLGDLIVEVLESPTISACRAKAGREHFEREYTIDVVVEQMIDFFERARAE